MTDGKDNYAMIHLKIPLTLYDKIKKSANDAHRPVATHITLTVEEIIEERESNTLSSGIRFPYPSVQDNKHKVSV